MQNRRKFIKTIGGLFAGAYLAHIPFLGKAQNSEADIKRLSIIFSCDTHGELLPFPENAPKYGGMGGIQARANLLKAARGKGLVVLLDGGDFFGHGLTFDALQGKAEIEAMNLMGYDAACMGESDALLPGEVLAERLSEARFPIMQQQKPIDGQYIFPTTVVSKEDINVGVIAVSRPEHQPKDVDAFYDALSEAAENLRKKSRCKIVVCLSRLGTAGLLTDNNLARSSQNIDAVLAGRSHYFSEQPERFLNKKKQEIFVLHTGWGGTHLGQLDYIFSDKKEILSANVQTVITGK